MVGEEMQFGGSKTLTEIDAKLDEVNCYSDVLCAGAEILRTGKQLHSRIEEGEPEYMRFLLHVIAKGESVVLGRKRKELEEDVSECRNDYCGGELNDPQYESFLKCLSEHEKSYVLKCETAEYKYEEHVHIESDEECDPEPQRKLKNAMNQPVGLSNRMAGSRNQYEHDLQSPETMNMTGRMTRSKSKSKIKTVEAGKTMSNEWVLSSDSPICQTARVEDKGKAIGKCDRRPGTKWIRGTRLETGSFGEMSGLANQCKYDLRSSDETRDLTRTSLKRKAMDEKVQKSLADEMMPDHDHAWLQKCSQVVNGGPATRLRSGTRQRTRSSSQMSGFPNEYEHYLQSRDVTRNLNGRELRNKTTTAKIQKSRADERPDPDYEYLQQHSQVINGRFVYTDDSTVVMYEKSDDDDENKQLSNDDNDDESNSDVEIIDHDMFHNAVNLFHSTAVSTEGVHDMNKTSKFREQLVNLLRKPYCEKEHEKLLQEVELRKPVAKHIELRNGRERSGSKHIDGKSYLDHYPDFERKLLLNQGDKAKCLNLLRGFFFWLQKSEQYGSFQPWKMNFLV